MATEIVQVPSGTDRQGMSPADIAAHEAASYVRRAPLPKPAVEALHRIEARLAVLPDGESTVINGATCTAVSGEVADLLERHARLQARCRKVLAEPKGFDADHWLDLQDELTMCRCQLKAAGRLDLIEVA